ncbi:hypothetical protein [Streptomyces sp. NRRL B-1347]|uniref:hypothetical protein n=1 Tax=Streptomyces sp. NRRL B-1347 TaxID=1476877 RepID=UPI0004CC5DB8|nr:hypothetical protein [Streptomyces sp. NRRL B-1347]
MADVAWIDIELVPRPVLHSTQNGQPERGVVYFGKPFTIPFDPASASETTRAYALERADVSRFRRMVLPLNLDPRPGEPLTSVAVKAVAHPADGRTLFLDPTPLRLASSGTRDSRVSVTAGFGLVQSQAETGSQRPREEPYLVARGTRTGTVQWELTRRSGQGLDGIYELTAIVEMPPDTRGEVELSAAAAVNKKRVGVIGYTALLTPDVKSLSLP